MTGAILYSKYVFPIEIERGELGYVSRCPTFDISSQGATKDEAHRMISEAVQLFIEDAFDAGTLKGLLKECGVDEEFEVNGIELPKQNAHCIEIYIPKGYGNWRKRDAVGRELSRCSMASFVPQPSKKEFGL